MHKYILKRILMLIPVILGASLLVFLLMDLAPGDIVDTLIVYGMTDEDIQALREYYNLHRSVFYRYAIYMFNFIRGDLGVSFITRVSVFETYMQRLPATLILVAVSFLFSTLISIPAGIFSARRAGRLADNVTTSVSIVAMSMPNFWLGLMLLFFFSLQLGWLPGGRFEHGWRSLVLPAFCIATMMGAVSIRQTRSAVLDVLQADYLRTARAKGVPEREVIKRHALGNAWIPIITQLGTSLGTQIAGSAVVETVFTWPGVGRAVVEAVMGRDVPQATGFIIMTSILFVSLQLVVDLLYAFVDPRIRSQYIGASKRKKKAAPKPQLAVASGPSVEPKFAAAEQYDDEPSVQERFSFTPADDDVSMEPEVPAISYATREFSEARSDVKLDLTDEDVARVIKTNRKRSQFGAIFHHMSKNKGAMAGLVILGIMVLLAVGGMLFVSWDSITRANLQNTLSPPTWQNLFGTDRMGRDLFLRVIYGTRYSLLIGFGAVAIASSVGISLGTISGYFGGKTDHVIMRFSDIISSVPGVLLGMTIMVVLGISVWNMLIAIGVGQMSVFIRITRASILSVRNNEFVEAAKATGLSNLRIMFTQVLPNGLSPIIVSITTTLGSAIIIGSSLSFLGFGVQVPTPEWGALIALGRDLARVAPWLMTFPGVFIVLTVLAFNLLGDGLRDALDPKLKK